MTSRRLPVPAGILTTVGVAAVVVLVGSWAEPWWLSAAAIGALLIGVGLIGGYPRIGCPGIAYPGIAYLGIAYPGMALAVSAAAGVVAAAAIDDSVPVWCVALAAGLFAIALRAGRLGVRPRAALIIFSAAALGALVTGVTGLVLLAVSAILPWVLGRGQRQQDQLVTVTAERARLRERARIAHDMHDTLGHELSLLALRAAALELDPGLGEPQRRAAGEIRAGAGSATGRLAEIVTLLRDDRPAPLHPADESIEDLIQRTVRAGQPVTLAWSGPRDLPDHVAGTAYRVVQEALTNAVKHAPGAPVTVRIATTTSTTTVGRTTVTATNPRVPGGARAPGGGSGLAGLTELAGLAGGTLRATDTGGRFEVVAVLPHAVSEDR
ncbi:sensor histidine kinase [Hamadaea tsunoensis]|uniref:sensor histidine kinase n=1 Tax=Hamadaea tsunoensis TaxID=53368 RepID=UPI0003FFD5B3|nr:histidine kinase [Hamadaea tsunoensis]